MCGNTMHFVFYRIFYGMLLDSGKIGLRHNQYWSEVSSRRKAEIESTESI